MSTMYKYQHIVATLKERIENGTYKKGERLPSMAQLREEFGASYGSIRTSIIILKTANIVEGRHGVGVFVL